MGDSSAFVVMNSFMNLAHVSVPQIGVEGLMLKAKFKQLFTFMPAAALCVSNTLSWKVGRERERALSRLPLQTASACTRQASSSRMGIRHTVHTQSVSPPQLCSVLIQSSGVVQNKSNHVIHEVSICQVSRFNECIWHSYQNSIIQGKNLHCT